MDSTTAEYRPELGPAQAELGPRRYLGYWAMTGPKITNQQLLDEINETLDLVARNLRHFMDNDGRLDSGDKTRQLEALSFVSRTSIQRITEGSKPKNPKTEKGNAVRIDTLIRLAFYFKVHFTEFFVPHNKASAILGYRSIERAQMEAPTTDLKRKRGRPTAD